jgi:hypothetical protein
MEQAGFSSGPARKFAGKDDVDARMAFHGISDTPLIPAGLREMLRTHTTRQSP